MIAADRRRHSARLVHVDTDSDSFVHTDIRALPSLLEPGDLVVVNDAATLPASLRLSNFDAELRLVAHADDAQSFRAVAFGAGDYHTDTDLRPDPPGFELGARLAFGPHLSAHVTAIDAEFPRLITLRFDAEGAKLWSELYRHGRPIQYRHVDAPLELWDVQNVFAARPFAFEPPSAALSLDHALLQALKRRGVRVASLTHAAGVSATGLAALDARLPFAERYEIPEATRAAIEAAHHAGGEVLAVGTTVVRALEASALEHGDVRAGPGEARSRLGPETRLAVVDSLLSGMHAQGTSHFELLRAFAPRELLTRVELDCEHRGYLSHEFGDLCLLRAHSRKRLRRAA